MAITDPTDLHGTRTLRGWYDASQTGTLTFGGGVYSRWDDAGPQGNDIGMTTSTYQPAAGALLNGVTTVRFTADFMTLETPHGSGVLGSPHTLTTGTFFYVVARLNTTESYGRIARTGDSASLDYNTNDWFSILRKGDTGSWPTVIRNGSFLLDPSSDLGSDGLFHRIIVRWTGTAAFLYFDGAQVATGSASAAFNFDDFILGALAESGSNDIAEAGWYADSLTTGEITDLDDYLDGKWFGTAPSAPRGLSVSAGYASGSLNVWWEPPASDGGVAISDYVIQYRTSAGPGSWSTFSDGTSTATGTTITGLSNGTAYDVQVAAVNSIGTSSYSSTVGPTTPSAPASITVAPTVAMPAPSYRI
jgi:hypothetical protein